MSKDDFWESAFARACRKAAAKAEAEHAEAEAFAASDPANGWNWPPLSPAVEQAATYLPDIDWGAIGAQAVKRFEQNIADAIFAKSERDGGGLAAVITATESVQTPPSAAGDPTHVFRAMRRSRQGLAMYEREP